MGIWNNNPAFPKSWTAIDGYNHYLDACKIENAASNCVIIGNFKPDSTGQYCHVIPDGSDFTGTIIGDANFTYTCGKH